MKNSYAIKIEHNKLYASGMKIGNIVPDPDARGRLYLELLGSEVFEFASKTELTLWTLKNVERYIPQVRAWLLQHVQRLFASKLPVTKYTPRLYGRFIPCLIP